MKRIYYITLLSLIVLPFGCDKIEEPYIREDGGGNGNDTTALVKKILLEDFTGHKCVNCPGAAIVARELHDQYDDQLIFIAVHAGWFAKPGTSGLYTTDFRTEVGEELDEFFGVSAQGNPNGMVNRIGEGTERVLLPGEWAQAIGEEAQKPAEAEIVINPDYKPATRTLDLDLEITFIDNSTDLYRVCGFIIEDSIIAPQMNNDTTIGPVPDIEDYLHRHVLRGSVNGTWGDPVFDGEIEGGVTYTLSYTGYQLDNAWIDHHCSLVAFIYREGDLTIIQVEEEHIM